jgi:hypothetical protein
MIAVAEHKLQFIRDINAGGGLVDASIPVSCDTPILSHLLDGVLTASTISRENIDTRLN